MRSTTPIDWSDTRRSCASFGSSAPDASAQAFRRSSRSQSCSLTSRRVGRSSAAGCTRGSTWASASLPSAASAAEAARSGPTASAVATRTRERSAAMSSSSAATSAPPKSPKAGRPVGPDHDPGAIEPSMRDPQGVEPPGVAPDALQELVVDLVGIERAQRAAGDLGHQQRVALGRHPGRHHREHRDAGPLGQQRDERLVLDLLAAAQGKVRPVVPVPQRGPDGGEQLTVPGVPAVDLDQQRAPVRRLREGDGHAAGLQRRLAERGGVDTQLGQGAGDLVEGEPTRRGAEQQVDDGGRPDPDGERHDHPDGEAGPQGDPGRRPDPDHPPPHVAERPRHVRRGGDDHRGGQRQAHRQVDGGRAGRADRPEAVRPAGPGQRSGDERDPDRERAREQLVEQQALAPVGEEGDGDEHQRPEDQQVVGDLPEPAEEPGKTLDQAGHERVERGGPGRREGQRRDRDDGEDEQHHVDRTPGPRGVAGRREHPDVAAPRVERPTGPVVGPRWRDGGFSLRLRVLLSSPPARTNLATRGGAYATPDLPSVFTLLG